MPKILPISKICAILYVLSATNVSASALNPSCIGYDCLKEYVDLDDGAYKWEDTGRRIHVPASEDGGGWTGYYLNFTSQRWLTPEQVSQSEWWHMLVVIVPEELEVVDTTFLFITGSDNTMEWNEDETSDKIKMASHIAVNNRMVAASLFQVPNQPIVYADDPEQMERREDDSIGWTWFHYLNDESSDPEFLLRLPMTKAGVKALDTVENFLTSSNAPQEIQELELAPTHHIISGKSKRGWTTWTVGAVDPRAIAIIPIVMDELNFLENLKHHYRSLAGWTFAFKAYWDVGIPLYLQDPKLQTMFDIVDPFAYKEKLMMPKLVCNAADDEFFLPDDTRYWWHQMPQNQLLNRFLTLPNSDHSTDIAILQLWPAMTTWIREILRGNSALGLREAAKTIEERNLNSLKLMEATQVPQYNWTISESGEEIIVMADRQPLNVNLWHASTCPDHANLRKDFRLWNIDSPCVCGVEANNGLCVNLAVTWTSRPLEETHPGSLTWVAHWPAPADGQWSAFYVDLQFQGPSLNGKGWPVGKDGIYEFTTSISIVPDTFPVEECFGEECLAGLV